MQFSEKGVGVGSRELLLSPFTLGNTATTEVLPWQHPYGWEVYPKIIQRSYNWSEAVTLPDFNDIIISF